ncbi:MAG TPA: hypothetical protein VFQ65_31100 [Kofleriaceae bacterium]|nr:hypothetical protein [Kofleriaceae bacterium]
MATDDEPTRDAADDKLAEKLTERIRAGTVPPPLRDSDDKLTESIRARLEHLVPELVKKTFAAGMGAVFLTEEGIRRLARENLPDVVGYAANATSDAKDKVWEIIALQTREFLSNLNLTEEIAKLLTTLSFEIKTEVRFIPNSERLIGSEPDVKASVRLKRNDKAADKGDKPDKPEKHDKHEKHEKHEKHDKHDNSRPDDK